MIITVRIIIILLVAAMGIKDLCAKEGDAIVHRRSAQLDSLEEVFRTEYFIYKQIELCRQSTNVLETIRILGKQDIGECPITHNDFIIIVNSNEVLVTQSKPVANDVILFRYNKRTGLIDSGSISNILSIERNKILESKEIYIRANEYIERTTSNTSFHVSDEIKKIESAIKRNAN